MTTTTKVMFVELCFFVVLPVLGVGLYWLLGWLGLFLYVFLFVVWCWELYAYAHYRVCRQAEFLYVMQTAAATQAPLEAVLGAYLEDRPREHLWRGSLLFFVFPGYYGFHLHRSFDARLDKLAAMLESGVPLDQAIHMVPGVVSRETALAVTVGQFSGRLPQALERLPNRSLAARWLEMAPRLMYPLLILGVLLSNLVFLMTFIIPRFEKLFADFKLKLPAATQALMDWGRRLQEYGMLLPSVWLLLLVLVNLLMFSSRAKWYCPLVSWVYRLHARGQFLQVLGLMLETGKPLPGILDRVIESELLPNVVARRVEQLAFDLVEGQPLAASLAKQGLVTEPMRGLVVAAEKAQNLPWALQELGDTLARRSARIAYRIEMVLFPLAIFACACLVAFVAVAMFLPLIALMESQHAR
jgi:type II secretory pathway component PulF